MTRMLGRDCRTPDCDCAYMQELMAPFPQRLQVTSILSETDGIVPAPASVLPVGNNILIDGSHSGLMFNAQVYPHIAAALAA